MIEERLDGTYFKSEIFKINNQYIDCYKLFEELKEIEEGEYIIRKYDGSYFSPSFLKSFTTNPAGSIISLFCKQEENEYLKIGTDCHLALEKFYSEGERTKERLMSLISEITSDYRAKNYISNYWDTKDYLKDYDDYDTFKCDCELKGKSEIYIPKYNKKLPLCSYIIDRIDYRKDKIFIVDYKTGQFNANTLTFDGYLAQMLLYKWITEELINKEIDGIYLCSLKNKVYKKCDDSEENERKLIDIIDNFFEELNKNYTNKIYEWTDKGYFNSDELKKYRRLMNDENINKIPVELKLEKK